MAESRRLQRRQLLANVSIFSSLSERELDLLVDVTTTRRVEARETVYRKGDPGDQLYGVLSGLLKVTAAGADGKEIVFLLCDPGEVNGEIALLDRQPRSASFVAIEPSELLVLHRRDFFPFLERHPKVAIRLAQILAARVRRLSTLTEDMVFAGLPARLAKRLLALAKSYGTSTPEGTRIDLRLPQQELGELVGTSRESVNKQLRAWVQEELVAVDRGFITLLDCERLEDLALDADS
ncbi:MAG: Crp/Fnr family transcriptional regulator [Proteobacteria bacterium]|nr:Crp/Fnr family transcriptional regulator [Pseudomonadota bacterium]